MSLSLNDSASDGQLSDDEMALASKVLDYLRFRIERLISQEISATPVQGVGRRGNKVSVQSQPELFDDVTGKRIFG